MENNNDTFSIFFLFFDFTHKHLPFVYQAVSWDGRHVKDSRCNFHRQDTFHCTESNIIVQFWGRGNLIYAHLFPFLSLFIKLLSVSYTKDGLVLYIGRIPTHITSHFLLTKFPSYPSIIVKEEWYCQLRLPGRIAGGALSQWSLVNCLEEFQL